MTGTFGRVSVTEGAGAGTLSRPGAGGAGAGWMVCPGTCGRGCSVAGAEGLSDRLSVVGIELIAAPPCGVYG